MNDHDERRAAAIDRIANKRDFRNHALVYCAINTLLVVIWAASGAGYFWPIWVIAGWGIGLAAHAWRIYGENPVSEAEIIEEMNRVEERSDRRLPEPTSLMQSDARETENPVAPFPSVQQANLDLVMRAGTLIQTGFANSDEELFAHDFVFHFVNPQLTELDGDHHGYDGFRSFFERLHRASDTGFQNEPHSLTPYGDELVVANATNTVSFGGTMLDVDAIVVWRIVDGRISEAWDIPAINTVRLHQSRTE